MFKKVNPFENFPKLEERILDWWDENEIFQKSMSSRAKCAKFVFYEGPPTANAKAAIHHVLARVFKDIICRYKTMQGFYVKRKAGWDTHGLPVELEVEKQLGFSSKTEIEKYGIAKFNQKCRENVWIYKADWEQLTKRIGFWLDMSHPYVTYENSYIEKVWVLLCEIFKKGLLYLDFQVSPYCPRCGTSLSDHEVAQGYEQVYDQSVYVKFKIKNGDFAGASFLVWTTTPWTLPSNLALAVNRNLPYVLVQAGEEKLILAKDRINVLNSDFKILKEFKGEALIDTEYEPPYLTYASMTKQNDYWKVLDGEFVNLEEGTGIVHIAPHYGQDDLKLFKQKNINLPGMLTVDLQGILHSLEEKLPGDGKFVKKADEEIIADLEKRRLLFKKEKILHNYPFCWRCNTPLIYYAKEGWFIKMTELKNKLLNNNQQINWVPSYLKDGRFGQWLDNVVDWAISRERYWGTPIPIWRCQNPQCQFIECFGKISELVKRTSRKLQGIDLHRPYVDELIYKCPKCGNPTKRIPDVLDVWFDSGAMPFASGEFPNFYPADYICEGIDQTRGWFYTLLAISTLLNQGTSYKNVISTGLILDEKGKKMSKSKGNVVVPEEVIGKFGADCLRWYFYTNNPVGENIRFSLNDLKGSVNRFRRMLWNVYAYFVMYAQSASWVQSKVTGDMHLNLLDKWILSQLNLLKKDVSENLDKFEVTNAARKIETFVDLLSNWYLRRSKKRCDDQFFETLYIVLLNLSQILAPFTPFLAEEIFQNLRSETEPESVHLCLYPKWSEENILPNLNHDMQNARQIVNLALALRMQAKIKVRQPLTKLQIKSEVKIEPEIINLIAQEINVKEIEFVAQLPKPSDKNWLQIAKPWAIALNIEISFQLWEEGILREIIRTIQNLRKRAKYEIIEKATVFYETKDQKLAGILQKYAKEIEAQTKTKPSTGKITNADHAAHLKIAEGEIWLGVHK